MESVRKDANKAARLFLAEQLTRQWGPTLYQHRMAKAEDNIYAPEDAGSLRGARIWLALVRQTILSASELGSLERRRLIDLAKKQFWYAGFLFRRNKRLGQFYSEAEKTVEDLFHTSGE